MKRGHFDSRNGLFSLFFNPNNALGFELNGITALLLLLKV